MEENFSQFAKVYDSIMDDSLYDKWLAFSQRHFPADTRKVLELACGTGILSEKLITLGYEVTGLDLSEEMLAIARQRATKAAFVQGDMRYFQLNDKFDAVTCYSDSLCYLSALTEVQQAARQVWSQLTETGAFLFDVHSTYQTDIKFPGFAYHDNAEDFAFMWDTYAGAERHSVQHELTFFVKNADGSFTRKDELHAERTYEIEQYLSALSCFRTVNVFADFTDEAPKADSERWFFVCQK